MEYIKDKLFKVRYMRGGLETTAELTVVRGNVMAVLCRTKKGGSLLIDAEDLIELDEILPPVVVPKLVVRTLAALAPDQIRQHLFDRHGVMSNEIPDDIDRAVGLHDLLHATPHLGHRHGRPDTARPVLPTEEEIAQRAADLDAEYENALECDSCGYVRLPDEEGRKFYTTSDPRSMQSEDTPPEKIMHCEDCKDEEEFKYT